ncbi:hypothetical protein JCM1841_005558 [Sporobolomyces salmonicolor]
MAPPESDLADSVHSALPASAVRSPAHDPAARLSRSRHLNHHLRTQLEQAKIALAARRSAHAAVQPSQSPEQKRVHRREQALSTRLDQRAVQVEHARHRRALSHAVVRALDHSLLVSAHLLEQPSSLRALLAERDTLALALLSLRKEVGSLSSERLKLRKRLLALNRDNAALASSLRALDRPASDLIKQLPAPVQAHYSRLQDDLVTTASRLAIIANVFQLLVTESGVPFFDPASFPAFASSSSSSLAELLRSEEDGHEEEALGRMGRKRLLGLLLEAGDSTAGGGGGRRWEDGQELPRNLRGVMEAWRAERRRGIEGEGQGGEAGE